MMLCLFLICSCGEGGSSEGKVLLYVYSAKVNSVEADPFNNVSFVGIFSSGNGSTRSKIMEYSPQMQLSLDGIPFGNDIRITIEGYTKDPYTGEAGNLISRGRTLPLDIQGGTSAQVIPIIMSRVSQFSGTTGIGENGTFLSSLVSGRVGHGVVALNDGRILITGGVTLNPESGGMYRTPSDVAVVLDSAEIYDPVSGIFSAVMGPIGMNRSRAFHTATVLPDGRVLLAGGITEISGSIQTLKEVQFFDPSTNSFSDSFVEKMTVTRAGHTATLIDSEGRILFAGGFELASAGPPTTVNSVEVFDPEKGTIYPVDPSHDAFTRMKHGRYFHRAAQVPIGSGESNAVVFIGGEDNDTVHNTVEIFRLGPASMDAEIIQMNVGRTGHTATYVPSQGFVHVVGGFADKARTTLVEENFVVESLQVTSVQFFSLFSSTLNPLLSPRGAHDAVLMDDDSILVFGGYENGTPLPTANVLFDYRIPYGDCKGVDKSNIEPGLCNTCTSNATCITGANQCSQLDITGQFCTKPCIVDSDCPFSFYCHALVGSSQPQCVPKGELNAFSHGGVGSMQSGRGAAAGVLLGNGMVLATGGIDSSGQLNTIGEIFNPL